MGEHELLGVSRETFEELRDEFTERRYDGLEYRHLPDGRRGLERGTVLIADTAVRGFPKVPRTLVIDPGVPERFDGRIAVEEKLNGYNVRIARIEGRTLAFTRSGIVCPYTSWLADGLGLEGFFEDHPERMLCMEAIGPENPYTAHDYPGVNSIALRAFDVRHRETGEPLSVRERRELCEEYGIGQTPLFGTYEQREAVRELPAIVEALDEEGREGVVMKSLDGSEQLKYTTSATHRSDLAFAFSLPFDYGREFLFRRLIREAFQSVEFEEGATTREERARALGEAILLPMADAVETVESGGRVGERHTVRGDSGVLDALLDHLRDQGLTVEIEEDRREDGERVVTFLKRTQSTNDKIRTYLDGTIVRE
ncbi:RNA ligase [Halalkalicoccus ordinarius]|uniref:RNA ligase n=1 Tax=Halalkalicoccus ordinarius TaxID=3116651 RepID=UPI00300F108D